MASEDKPKPNCTSYFDEIYFCYSPVYQIGEMYRKGTLDDCRGKWSDFYECLSIKADSPNELRERVERRLNKPSMWVTRTQEEAVAFWASQFPSCHAAAEAGKRQKEASAQK